MNRPTSVLFCLELEPPILAPAVLVLPAPAHTVPPVPVDARSPPVVVIPPSELELVTFPLLPEQPATACMATVKNAMGWENPPQPRLFIANPRNAPPRCETNTQQLGRTEELNLMFRLRISRTSEHSVVPNTFWLRIIYKQDGTSVLDVESN